MNIRLHIEELVLDGLPLSQHQGALVQAAMKQELCRLLGSGQLGSWLASAGAMPELQGGSIRAASAASPTRLGVQIAGGLYTGIGQRI